MKQHETKIIIKKIMNYLSVGPFFGNAANGYKLFYLYPKHY